MIIEILIVLLVLWDIIWKALGLWYSARNKDKIWFVILLLLSTAGILPILYLYFKTSFFKRKKKNKKRR